MMSHYVRLCQIVHHSCFNVLCLMQQEKFLNSPLSQYFNPLKHFRSSPLSSPLLGVWKSAELCDAGCERVAESDLVYSSQCCDSGCSGLQHHHYRLCFVSVCFFFRFFNPRCQLTSDLIWLMCWCLSGTWKTSNFLCLFTAPKHLFFNVPLWTEFYGNILSQLFLLKYFVSS